MGRGMTQSEGSRSGSLAPNLSERFLGGCAAILLAVVVAAVAKGHAHWAQASPLIWAHLATIAVALALTPVMLLRRRGDRLHRRLGWIWILSLTATAALSFGIRTINPGGLSLIHVLSAFTLVQVPMIAWAARTHRVAAHRKAVHAMVLGALLIAGFFTFPFHRMLGRWLFG